MKKFRILWYQKSTAMLPTRNARLIITDKEYIIKTFIITVARYEIEKTLVSKISFISKGINLDDGEREINLFFPPKTADKIYDLLKLK